MENNVKIFYEKKELYETIKENLINDNLFYVYHSNEGNIIIEVNQDLRPKLRKIDGLGIVLDIIKDVIESKKYEIQTRTIDKLNKNMESSKKKAMEDFGMSLKEEENK